MDGDGVVDDEGIAWLQHDGLLGLEDLGTPTVLPLITAGRGEPTTQDHPGQIQSSKSEMVLVGFGECRGGSFGGCRSTLLLVTILTVCRRGMTCTYSDLQTPGE